MNSIKILINEAGDARKQWLALMLVSKVFDTKSCKIEESTLATHVNMLMHGISNIVSKNELLSDLSVTAIMAWNSVLQTISYQYDSKTHASAMLINKQIAQNVIRKLDKIV